MPQMTVLGKARTKVEFRHGGDIAVKYWETDIVKIGAGEGGGRVHLDSRGFKTHTTMNRMNQASYQFGLGYTVSNRNGLWYVETKRQVWFPFDHEETNQTNLYHFQDGMLIYGPDGRGTKE